MSTLSVKRKAKNCMCTNPWDHYMLQYISAHNKLNNGFETFVTIHPLKEKSDTITCRCVHCLKEEVYDKLEHDKFLTVYEDKLIVPENRTYNRMDRFYENMKLVNQFRHVPGMNQDIRHTLKIENKRLDLEEQNEFNELPTNENQTLNGNSWLYKTEEEVAKESRQLLMTKDTYNKRTNSYYS